MKIYGGCIEPEGQELDNDTCAHECDHCGGRGFTRNWQAAEGGSLNFYSRTWCADCHHEEGDGDDDGDEFYESHHMSEADYAAVYAEFDEILEADKAAPPPLTFRQKIVEIAKGLWH